MTVPPQKIQMIKDLREVSGVGLGEAKAVIDWMYRVGGPIERLIREVAEDPQHVKHMTFGHVTMPIIGSFQKPTYDSTVETDGSLEERVARIERWIQNQ